MLSALQELQIKRLCFLISTFLSPSLINCDPINEVVDVLFLTFFCITDQWVIRSQNLLIKKGYEDCLILHKDKESSHYWYFRASILNEIFQNLVLIVISHLRIPFFFFLCLFVCLCSQVLSGSSASNSTDFEIFSQPLKQVSFSCQYD